MTKMKYNENMDRILCDTYRDKKDSLFRLKTSGSTGAPFTVLCDGDKMNRVNMNFISFMELNGFRMGMKRGEFRVWIPGKNVISKWKSFKNNLLMIDISNMGDEALEKICERIKKQRIQVLVIYSSALIVQMCIRDSCRMDQSMAGGRRHKSCNGKTDPLLSG